MRFKVPQNIDMQDRVIGPLTMVQFVELVVAFGVGYMVYNSLPSPLSWFVLIPVAILSLAVVFLKVNERPFHIFLLSVIQYFTSPRQRLWKQDEAPDTTYVFTHEQKKIKVVESKNISQEEISAAAKKIDESEYFKVRK
jgi:hypothetical protein